MKQANIYKTIDTHYKEGKIECRCGWCKELGNGFNQYFIDNCPSCTPELETRNQRKVIYSGGSKNNMIADIGSNAYFVLSNGINVRYSFSGNHITGLSMRKADNL